MPPLDEPVDPKTYICGPGDILELNFWGLQNFRLRVTVDMEGRAFVPKIGYQEVAGKTLAEVRLLMRQSVARYFPRLQFDVALTEPRTFLVQLVDDVARPGSHAARAVDRVATLIAREGGLGANASKRRIEILRRDGSQLQVDLLLFQTTGDVRYNPFLLDGDVVRVPFEDLAATISGAVNRPGRYELTGNRDLAELVELAGGLAPSATRELPVSLVRRLPDDRQNQELVPFASGGALPELPLQKEDSVRIPDLIELQRSVVVVGALFGVPAPMAAGGVKLDEASATRRLPFVEGDTVRTLLVRVNGVGPLADLKGSYVLREGKTIPVDLYSLLVLRDLKADVPVQLGDTLVVPFKQRNIVVQGAVFTPGSYPFNPNFGVEQYLALAGGRNRFARELEYTRIITPNGETSEYKPGIKIEPGSSLVVPERDFSRPEVVQIAISIATMVVSGVAVLLATRR
ncbi:MAG TPA: SLBB domain-containing protein [Anaeromyxobacter sp.]|nr:SLBB domain-containing protein [Anaeromyxobacter sp.]